MTSDQAKAWPRPNRDKASAARARQHYVAFFADEPTDIAVDAAALPPGDPLGPFEVEAYTDPAWVRGWTAGPLGDLLDLADAVDADAVRACASAMAAWCGTPDPLTLAGLQGGMALCRAFAEAGAVAVLDVVSLRWWAAAELLALAPDRDFDVTEHVAITFELDVQPGAPGHFLHTRGLAKFARPDLGLHVADPTQAQDRARALNLLATAMALGLDPQDGDTTRAGGLAQRLVLRPDDTGAESPLFFNRWFELLPPLALS